MKKILLSLSLLVGVATLVNCAPKAKSSWSHTADAQTQQLSSYNSEGDLTVAINYPSYPSYPSYPYYPSYSSYPYQPSYPDYSSYPDYPSYPSYPGYSSYPEYPSYPYYPSYSSYPEYSSYPNYPSYPSYPQYPSYPGASVSTNYDIPAYKAFGKKFLFLGNTFEELQEGTDSSAKVLTDRANLACEKLGSGHALFVSTKKALSKTVLVDFDQDGNVINANPKTSATYMINLKCLRQ